MDISHLPYGFGVTPEEGYRAIFINLIDNWDQPICDATTVPLHLDSFEYENSNLELMVDLKIST